MKLVLKKDWDIPLHPPLETARPKGFFVGRENEVRLLTNELTRKDSGSILVTGYRGVGKTSLVYKAVANVRAADENVIVVLISASQLQAEGETAAKPNPSHNRVAVESISGS